MLKDKLALVTGGAGFIGSYVVRLLLEEGATVRVMDDLSSGYMTNLEGLGDRLAFMHGDVRIPDQCRAACEGVDTVFHMAAYTSVPGTVTDPTASALINNTGTLNMLIAARDSGARRLVFSSSASIYGNTTVVPTPEDTVTRPASPYGVEKLYDENMVRLFWELYGFETVALRYFNVFGPRQNPDSDYAAVIPKFITMMLAGKQPTIFGDGTQTRDFLFAGDVARANIAVAKDPKAVGQYFNIAGGTEISVTDLYVAISAATGAGFEPRYGPARVGDIHRSVADVSKATAKIGFKPSITLAEGLQRTVDYYRSIALP